MAKKRRPSQGARSRSRVSNAPRAQRRGAAAPIKRSAAPSAWYTDLPSAERRRAVLKYLREAVAGRAADQRNTDAKHEPGLRDIYPGFDPADGYDLRDIKQWTRAQHDKVQDAIKVVRQLLASPYRLVSPRDKQQRKTLEYFTQQYSQRRYIVHVATPDARVKFFKERGKKLPGVAIRRPQRFGGFGQLQFWMFPDYNGGVQPETAEEFVEATRAMIPDMPAWGYFSLWSRTNGVITIPQPRNSLVRVMQRFFDEGESFGGDKLDIAVDLLQGWVLQGNEEDANRVYAARQKRQRSKPNRWANQQYQKRQKQRAQQRAKVTRHVSPKTKRVKKAKRKK